MSPPSPLDFLGGREPNLLPPSRDDELRAPPGRGVDSRARKAS